MLDASGGTLVNDGRVGFFSDIFYDAARGALDGFAPIEAGPLGLAFDPEGIVVNPLTGHLLLSDEYGPSVVEIDGAGQLVRRYQLPSNVLSCNALSGVVNHANDTGNTAGKRTNRGFEGLAISPDGRTLYAMLQSAMLDEGGSNGTVNRIVAFDTRTARPLAQPRFEKVSRVCVALGVRLVAEPLS